MQEAAAPLKLGEVLFQDKTGLRVKLVRNEGKATKAEVSGNRNRHRGSETANLLDPHMDGGAGLFGHDIETVGLLVFKQAETGGESIIVDTKKVYAAIKADDPDAAQSLQEEFPYDRAISVLGGQSLVSRGPIINEAPFVARASVRIAEGFELDGEDLADFPDKAHALEVWKTAIGNPDNHLTITVPDGGLLLLDDHRIAHGRGEFEPTSPRTLGRMWWGKPYAR
jgi:hypothetical protein